MKVLMNRLTAIAILLLIAGSPPARKSTTEPAADSPEPLGAPKAEQPSADAGATPAEPDEPRT